MSKTIQVIYKCYTGNLKEYEIESYLENEKQRVQDSLNVDPLIKYNVTVIPMCGNYSAIETLPDFS